MARAVGTKKRTGSCITASDRSEDEHGLNPCPTPNGALTPVKGVNATLLDVTVDRTGKKMVEKTALDVAYVNPNTSRTRGGGHHGLDESHDSRDEHGTPAR